MDQVQFDYQVCNTQKSSVQYSCYNIISKMQLYICVSEWEILILCFSLETMPQLIVLYKAWICEYKSMIKHFIGVVVHFADLSNVSV